jgi:hypothetical protein
MHAAKEVDRRIGADAHILTPTNKFPLELGRKTNMAGILRL